MKNKKVQRYFEEFELAVSRKNGDQLAKLLTIDPVEYQDIHPVKALAKLEFVSDNATPSLDESWKTILEAHLAVLNLQLSSEALLPSSPLPSCPPSLKEEIFKQQLALALAIQRIFQSTNRWLLPTIHRIHKELWYKALDTGQESCQEECARTVNKLVTICLTDRSPLPQSRKWGVYRIVSLLFQIYFHLGQLNLSANVLRAMGAASDLPDILLLPKSQLVQYGYWLGRYYFVGEQWDLAEEQLLRAFTYCSEVARRNKRLILHYLIPLRLFRGGLLPSDKLLKRYELHLNFYQDAIRALKSGDVHSFSAMLTKFEKPLLKLGTFLLWERIELIVLRNLTKRVHQIIGGGTRLALSTILAAIKVGVKQGKPRQPMDLDQIACWVAVLVAKGMIRGYISQEKAMIVLSQKDPFPKLQVLSIT